MNTFVRVFVFLAYVTLVLGLSATEVHSPSFLASLEKWWGPLGEEGKASTDVRPFKVKYSKEMIEDLRYRIRNRRAITPPLEGTAFQYGFNAKNMDYWMDFWANEYNFTERVSYLNKYPQYKTNIQGLDIHFIRVRPQVPEGTLVIPLLMLHGWPGCVAEFYDAIPLITEYSEESGFAVEVIVPSLPGFGFSDGTTRPGLGEIEMAVVLRNLMHRLGIKKFYVQAGDLGALISNNMVTLYPEEVLGYHTNFAVSLAPGSLLAYATGSLSPSLQSSVVDPSVADRMYPITDVVLNLTRISGYLHMQATKPDTLGVGMSDSPMALLAWILWGFSAASRKSNEFRVDGGLHELYTPEKLIDVITMYWAENKFTTAIRLYAESFNLRTFGMGLEAISTPVPTCTIHAKDELIYESPEMLKYKFPNLLRSTVLDSFGHFLALEAPAVFSKDVREALVLFREYHEKNKHKKHCEL